ncbi:MAG: hypothetical protein ACK410_09505 [Acinetobacter sp.]
MNNYHILLTDNRNLLGWNDFRNSSFYVWDEIHPQYDHSTGDHRATSWLIDNNQSIDQAKLVAAELLSIIIGIFKAKRIEHLSAAFMQNGVKLLVNGLSTYTYAFSDIEIPNFTLARSWESRKHLKPQNYSEISNLKNNIFDALIYLAAHEDDVYIILRLVASQTSWLSLCMIYETIEEFGEKNDYPHMLTTNRKKKLDTKQNETKLTKPANCFSITGFSSRHGYRHESKPVTTDDCFNLEQATDYVYTHVRKYINWKLDIFHSSSIFTPNS